MNFFKIKPFKGIRLRWLISSFSTALVIVIISLSAVAVFMSNYYYATVRATLESRAKQTAGFFDRYYNNSRDEYYASAYRWAEEFKDRDKLELQFISAGGRIEITTAGPAANLRPETGDVKKTLETAQLCSWIGEDPLTGERVISVSAPLLYGGSQVIGAMRYISSLRIVDRQIMQMMGLSLLVGLAFIVIVVIINLTFIRSIILPIREINEVAKRISEGRYGVRIEKKYDDEIGELVDNINHMSSEISAAERMKTDFISSVSHELRTPLTAITGWGETLLMGDIQEPHEFKKGVRVMLKETSRLSKMVEELLDFTRVEGGRMVLQIEETDVCNELEEVVYMYMNTARREGIELNSQIEEGLQPVLGDRARLKQVFLNVLDNATKHGGDGKRIDITLYQETDWIVVMVKDFGQGIPPEELPHVKYKFYKGASKARGSGIGLAVSDEIIRLHDGRLDIESEQGKGTCVFIRLPIYEPGL